MANFTINIAEREITPYKRMNSTNNLGSGCQTESNASGGENQMKVSVDLSDPVRHLYALVSDYEGAAMSKIYIRNVIHDEGSGTFSMSKDFVQMEPATTYEFDVSGLGKFDEVPGLRLTIFYIPNDIDRRTVSYEVQIEDVNGEKYGWVSCVKTVFRSQCPVVSEPTIIATSALINYDACGNKGNERSFKITAQPYALVNVSYRVTQKGAQGFFGRIAKLDSENGSETGGGTTMSNEENVEKKYILNGRSDGIHYLKVRLCPNQAGADLSGRAVVAFSLKNNDYTEDIATFNIQTHFNN